MPTVLEKIDEHFENFGVPTLVDKVGFTLRDKGHAQVRQQTNAGLFR